jgi:hypothetical protein
MKRNPPTNLTQHPHRPAIADAQRFVVPMTMLERRQQYMAWLFYDYGLCEPLAKIRDKMDAAQNA